MSRVGRIDGQEIATQEHIKFVDEMFPRFGLEVNSGYSEVEIRPYLLYGGADFRRTPYILVSSNLNENVFRYTTWHESGHYLHSISQPNSKHGGVHYGEMNRKTVLVEAVADLSALIFLDITEGPSQETIEKYELKPPLHSYLNLDQEGFDQMIEVARNQKGILKRLASGRSLRPLMKFVRI